MYGTDFEERMHSLKSPERELSEIEQQIAEMQRYRQKLIHRASKKEVDPVVELAVTLAHEAGELKGRYEGQKERNDKQQQSLETLREKLVDLEGIQQTADTWRNRAAVAEESLARKAKRARRK